MHRRSLIPAPLVFDFSVVAERLDIFAQLHERPERSDPRNFALHQLPNLVRLEPIAPDIVDLLDAQRYAAIFRIDLQHLGGDWLALAENFVRILHPPGPTHIPNMHQTVESILDFDE